VTGLPAQDVALAKKDGLDVITNEKAGWVVTFISLNFNKPPFNNPLVAKAVEDAINREQFVKELTFGLGTADAQPFPSTSPAYNPAIESEYPYDPAQAKKLLKQAGYKPGQLKLTLDVFTALESSGAELLQQQLAAVSIKLTIDTQNIDQFYTGYYGKTDEITLYGYVGRDSKLVALDEHYADEGILNLSSPRVAPQYAAARQKVLSVPLSAPNYDSVLQAATKAGVDTGSTISLYSSPQPYASKSIHGLPLIDDVIRWNGVTVG
jgi:peptide/nickel transport system substrate-binding protein